MPTSEATTRGVRVQVQSRYVPERSDPERGAWFFAYTVLITNDGDTTVQLMTRHWIITNANGHVEEVRGPGVVGAQPVLGPGESFEYTSACPLPTAFGTMHGSYQMVTEDGERFDAEIAPFSLAMPYAVNWRALGRFGHAARSTRSPERSRPRRRADPLSPAAAACPSARSSARRTRAAARRR